jgi:hypothetical protein
MHSREPLHAATHARAWLVEQILALSGRTPAARRALDALTDEQIARLWREQLAALDET